MGGTHGCRSAEFFWGAWGPSLTLWALGIFAAWGSHGEDGGTERSKRTGGGGFCRPSIVLVRSD